MKRWNRKEGKKAIGKIKSTLTAMLLVTVIGVATSWANPPKDYSRLIDFIKLKDRTMPLHTFSDYEEAFDLQFHKDSIAYFNTHPSLVQRIRKKLGSLSVQWRLGKLSQRLLFVPEKRKEYALLFETYCRDVINYILAATRLQNPYRDIQTLNDEKPHIKEGRGITAFLVHNLAKEYVATYIFSNPQQKKIQIELKGTVYTGTLGSYRSTIHPKEDGYFEFENDPYTVWQNSAENPYTALTVPVEETFHIVLRDNTDSAIRKQIESDDIRSLADVKKISAEWVAVEEAIVGGLVRSVLPEFLENRFNQFPLDLIAEDMRSKSRLKQYRYLKPGVAWVKRCGAIRAITRYKEDPFAFRKVLLR